MPGETISSLLFFGSTATEIVLALSCAEIPVVTPSRASIETVKAVSKRVALFRDISGKPSCSTRDRCIARQIRPLAYFAIKLMASGVAFSAGMHKSPSFSLFSSSTKIIFYRLSPLL